jgi:hypothetical protein
LKFLYKLFVVGDGVRLASPLPVELLTLPVAQSSGQAFDAVLVLQFPPEHVPSRSRPIANRLIAQAVPIGFLFGSDAVFFRKQVAVALLKRPCPPP